MESLGGRVGGLAHATGATAELFVRLSEGLARVEEQLGLNNARLDRVMAMFVAARTEATLRDDRIEQRLDEHIASHEPPGERDE